MNLHEIGQFIIPNIHDPVQVLFFVVMMGLAIGTSLYLYSDTGEKYWQAQWLSTQPKNANDDSILTGTLEDLQGIVRTRGEKLADTMPSILLVIGLLGTFLGLGVALNKAAQILNTPDAINMGHAGNNLTEMLGGIGVKFKTSTWGIITFLALRLVSSLTGYEAKRTQWCAAKIKSCEIERNIALLDEKKAFNTWLEHIQKNSADQAAQQQESNTVLNQIKAHTLAQIDFSTNQANHNDKLLTIINTNTEQLGAFISASAETMQKFADSTREMAGAANKNSEASEALQKTVTQFEQNVETILTSVKKDLSETIVEVGRGLQSSTAELRTVTDAFSKDMTEVLSGMQNTLQEAITKMGADFQSLTQNIGTEMQDGSRKISTAVEGMSDSTQTLMKSFQKQSEETQKNMMKVQHNFSQISGNLREAIHKNCENIERTTSSIEMGLQSIGDFTEKLTHALKEITAAAEKNISSRNG